MPASPSEIYSHSVHKQRILVLGNRSARLAQLITFVLEFNQKKFSYSTPSGERFGDDPVMLYAPAQLDNLSDFHHHMIIMSAPSGNSLSTFKKLADQTPKSGSLLYAESDSEAAAIAKVSRTDVTAVAYSPLKHDKANGKAVLISSTQERFETTLSTPEDLLDLGAVKDLVKKIGVSSGQFYRAVAAFR